MARAALLIGAQTHGLGGVEYDLDTMAELLESRGFAVRRCTGKDATRAGILDEYERVIADSTADDGVVVYYSGHGGFAAGSAGATPAAGPPPDLQFIVPADFDESAAGDFRGITALELSVRLARLTAVTPNVTVILDCCHASHMSRDPQQLLPKSLLHPVYLDVAAHNAAVERAGLQVGLRHAIGNPNAVRLVACAPWEVAYEYVGVRGHRTGMLTESFGIALAEAGDAPVSWSVLIERVRSRVQLLAQGQRPEVEGPAGRLLFDTAPANPAGVLPAVPAGGSRIRLPGARLLGVQRGDEFTVVTGAGPDGTSPVATARVDRIDGATVEADVAFQAGHSEIPPGARARPLRTAAPRRAVAVRGAGVLAEQVRAALAAAPLLRPADAGDDPFAEVVAGPDLVVRDPVGPLTAPRPGDADGVAAVIADLNRLARADVLRTITPEDDETLTEPFTLEWGRVVDGERRPLGLSGDVVHAGQQVYLRLVNESDRELFLTAFDLGVGGRVRIITTSDRSGLLMRPGHEQVIGRRDGGTLVGSAMNWPGGVPADAPRRETILVVVGSARQDLSALEQESIADAGTRAAVERQLHTGSSLQRIAAQLAVGGTRDWADDPGPAVRYTVRRIELTLSPDPAPAEETARFLVDERPAPSVRLLTPRSRPRADAPPPTVAVRLTELVVRRNRALRSADVRVDALVLTGGPDDAPAYRAQTARFSNVRDGQRLPMDNLLVYHGAAVDYLDLAWWVSRDRSGSLALSDLLREELNAEDVRQAALQLAGLAMTAPHAAAAVMAVGGTAVIVNLAYRLLSGVVGDSIGIYRTSLLAAENFGIGRHPASGVQEAQDFAFAYEIVPTA